MTSSPKTVLSSLRPGNRAIVVRFADSPITQRLMEMGLTPGSKIEVVHEAPFGGAIAVRCRGTLIAMRASDANLVEVQYL